MAELEANNQVLLRYAGDPTEGFPYGNPNGSVNDIAGVRNLAGNVFGMMPHPERACEGLLGSEDGNQIWLSILGEYL